jgi:hypothetical protein
MSPGLWCLNANNKQHETGAIAAVRDVAMHDGQMVCFA